MTTEELFTDLKQFITATISQQMVSVVTKDDLKEVSDELSGRIDRLDRKFNKLENTFDTLDKKFNILDEKVDIIHDAIAEAFQDHERRLRRIERRSFNP